jgi:hypothetical protein
MCVASLWFEKREAEKIRIGKIEREKTNAMVEIEKLKESIEKEKMRRVEIEKEISINNSLSPSKIDEYEYGLNLQCSTDNKLSLSIEDKFDLLLEHLGLKIEENKIEFKPYKIVSKKKK